MQRDCVEFAEMLQNNVVYLWNGWVHASETRKPLERNTGKWGMKRLTEEVVARNAEAIHSLVLVGIWVGGERASVPETMPDSGRLYLRAY